MPQPAEVVDAVVEVETLPDPVESLLAFFTTEEIGTACNLSDWTVQQEIELYVRIAKGEVPAKPNERMAAAERLRRLAFMALRLGGHIQDSSRRAVLTGDGENTQASITSVERTTRLVRSSITDAERALRGPVAGELPDGPSRQSTDHQDTSPGARPAEGEDGQGEKDPQ